MKDWTKKTMTCWQREMFERILAGLCHLCKEGEPGEVLGLGTLPGRKKGYYHWKPDAKGVLQVGDEKPCLASVVRLEVEKVYGSIVAKNLCRKRG